ncbi:uncharacterized protein PAC_18104 [Phialocephala subalpina]|uniref:Uncharacterized protein n=1 Tax=Phialocephala subalpina TaxID=576137 RepID=A0A1L7XT82_9HELO|nr:uncharacterized protein PAC_18104 [Phialocephala subalpina]
MKVVSGQPLNWPRRSVCNSTSSSINVTAEWAQYLNPHIQDTNKTVFHMLAEDASIQVSAWEDDPGFVQSVIESILTTAVANGLSRTESSSTIQGELNNCPNNDCDETCGLLCLDMMPKPTREFGYGVQVDVTGYAYNMRGATIILSCMVLLSYYTLVGVHFAFVLMKRLSSNAWDSVSEVMALAIQSQPTEQPCEDVVRTGVEYEHLELDFGDHLSGYGEKL